MEAAFPLRKSRVAVAGDVLHISELAVADETAVRLVREREESGADPAEVVADAIEIGARILDREQAGANTEFVKTELEKVAREVENQFGDRARAVAEGFEKKVDAVFDPESGQLSKSLDEVFSDGSSTAVQHRVKELVTESLRRSREDLLKQFSAADGSNPLADFKQGTLAVLKQADERQHHTQQKLLAQMAELEKQLQSLRAEKEKLEEVAEERERGTAKGRTYEESVAAEVDRIAELQGDVAEAVGDEPGAGGKRGDVVVALDAAAGPAHGSIVFEAKDRKLSKPKFHDELDEALAQRDADYAILVVPSEEEVPAKLHSLREYQGDKLIAIFDPEEGSALELEFAYRLARARVATASGAGDDLDPAAVRDTVARAVAAMDDVRRVKSQLTSAENGISNAKEILEELARRVRTELAEVDALLDPQLRL
jgi:hypothetical protein